MNTETVKIYYTSSDSGRKSSRDLLRCALKEYLAEISREGKNAGVPAGGEPDLTLLTGPHGKPSLAVYPEIHFSVSHSGEYWACAFAGEEVGLDLQEVQFRRWEAVSERFFHPAERLWLEGRTAEDFTLIWAYKESYIKYTGEGLSRGLESFRTVSEDGARITGAEGVCQQEVPFPAEGYRMVVTAGRQLPLEIEEL